MKQITIGVLGLQGSVEEHLSCLSRLPGVTAVTVKIPAQIHQVDALVLPGGESTTIAKLLHVFGLFEPLRQRIQAGMPVWGTCAGMILLAERIVGETPHLGVMDITVKRNAYGTQIDSFTVEKKIPQFSNEPIPLTFIRAPWIEEVGERAEVLCRIEGKIVAARQGNMLVTSFHPELTEDLSVHRFFVGLAERAANVQKAG